MHKVGTLDADGRGPPGRTRRQSIPDARRIPEATVARLPLYYRALLETAEQEIGTVSSERLAELAGVNAAKVRKDLSYLGSYGTRGVGYDVEYLLHEISRELGLTQDWPVVIVGIGNLGQALANYRGFGARGFRVVALVDADPAKVGRAASATSRSSALDDLPAIVARARRSRSASSPRPPPPRRRWPTAWSTPASRRSSTSRPRWSPCPTGVSLRKVDLAIELQILTFYQQRRQAAGVRATATARRVRDADERPRRDHGLPGEPASSPGRRCVVVGARPDRGPQDRGAARRRGRRARRSRPRSATRCAAWADAGRLTLAERAVRARRPRRRLARDHRHRRPRRQPGGVRRRRGRRVWVNSADDPTNCSFTLMSVVRQGDLVVTIGTGGRSPALATWLKARVRRARWAPSTRPCSTLLSEAREELRAGGRSSEDADWQQALDSGMLDLIRAGRVAEAKELLRACLSSSSD